MLGLWGAFVHVESTEVSLPRKQRGSLVDSLEVRKEHRACYSELPEYDFEYTCRQCGAKSYHWAESNTAVPPHKKRVATKMGYAPYDDELSEICVCPRCESDDLAELAIATYPQGKIVRKEAHLFGTFRCGGDAYQRHFNPKASPDFDLALLAGDLRGRGVVTGVEFVADREGARMEIRFEGLEEVPVQKKRLKVAAKRGRAK